MTSLNWPTEAKTRKHMHIHAAPMIKGLRRPYFSTKYRPGNVVTTLTAPKMICVRNEFEIPTEEKTVVP